MSKDRYAVIEKISVTTPGDARSKSHPGHGYPESTSHHETIREFPDRESWEAWIKKAATPRKFSTPEEFRAIVFREVAVELSVSVSLKEVD